MRICLDPGHGGKDPGAVGATGLKESNVNLSVVKKLQRLLEEAGHQVAVTRDKDVQVSLTQRTKTSNSFKADLFISVHCNSVPNTDSHGMEVWHHPDSVAGERLALAILDRLAARMGLISSRGLKCSGQLVVVRETHAPAVLVELGFISNPKEEKLLASSEAQMCMALGIAEGIKLFKKGE